MPEAEGETKKQLRKYLKATKIYARSGGIKKTIKEGNNPRERLRETTKIISKKMNFYARSRGSKKQLRKYLKATKINTKKMNFDERGNQENN